MEELANREMRKHKAKHDDKGGFECDLCSLKFKAKGPLKKHIKGIHLLSP